MNPSSSPFRLAWWGGELSGYRTCDSTYCFYPYDSLPPLDSGLFEDEFGWLPPLSSAMLERMALYQRSEAASQLATRLENIQSSAAQMGLRLPNAFLKFMAAPELQEQIPSSTACYFDLSEQIVQLPIDDGGYLIRFYNDQQDMLLWYLYLTPHGESCVVVSGVMFDEVSPEGVTAEQIKASLDYCAPSFEEFIYRLWLENDLWFALDEGRSLSDAQTAYLQHYQQ